MKFCVSSQGEGLDAQIDQRFGRCAYFVIVNSSDMSHESFDNAAIQAGGGAGIQAAKFIADKGAEVVLTGNCGPNAFETLQAAGIKVVTGASGTVKETVQAYLSGKLKGTDRPNVGKKFGMGPTS